MKMYGFVYIWYDSARSKQKGPDEIKRWYIGCHWGTEDDGYICSSNWMRDAMRRRPKDFSRRTLSKIYTNRDDLIKEEHQWLKLIKKEELGKKYYNLHNHIFGHSEKTCNKISQQKKGKRTSVETEFKTGHKGIHAVKGPRHTKEQKEKWSRERKGTNTGENNPFFGKQHSEETLNKIMNYKVTCPHCGKTGGTTMKRWHFDRCRVK
jgi:hypothetical protein